MKDEEFMPGAWPDTFILHPFILSSPAYRLVQCRLRAAQNKRGGQRAASRSVRRRRRLRERHVRGLEALRALDHVELDCRTFRQGAEALAVDGAEVNEDVLTRAGGDEAQTLRAVEPH